MDVLLYLVVLLLAFGIYFLPAFVAHQRRSPNETAILIVNLLFGWTLLGWGIALVWAVSGRPGEGKPDLIAVCSECGSSNAQTARFCAACGVHFQ